MHGSVAVRAEYAHPGSFETLQAFRVRMSIGIVRACGGDRDARLYGGKKGRRRRVLASVMANLQNVGAQISGWVFRKDGAFRLLLRVSGKEARW
jgi:hypothetical protein